MENKSAVRSMWKLAWLAPVAELCFYAFFQTAKNGPFRAINPFLDDPVDAIGSIAVQLGLITSLLALSRGVQVHMDEQRLLPRGRWVVNSGLLTWLAVVVTLLADGTMEILHPSWAAGLWGQELFLGLLFVTDVALLLGISLLRAMRAVKAAAARSSSDEAGSLSGGLEDVWGLAKVVVDWCTRHLRFTRRPAAWLERMGDRFLAWLKTTPVSPERHPWRFVMAAGVLVGFLLVLAGFQEGPPPNFRILLLLVAIFISVETSAALIGFLLFGGILGIRPAIGLADDSNPTL